jgi:hypothetical protein
MMEDVLRDRVLEHKPENVVEQENALTELIQHLVLASLSRAGFFSTGVFHGGTCLRILHGTSRFSEHLDFLLRQPDTDFRTHAPGVRRPESSSRWIRTLQKDRASSPSTSRSR